MSSCIRFSCIRFIQPDVCVCDLTSVRFSSASITSFCWSVLHDPLLRCTCTNFFRFFDLSMLSFDKCGLWEQQGFFKFTKRQECVSDFRTGTLWGRVTRPWGLETCRHDENGTSATRCPRHSHRRASVPADTPDGELTVLQHIKVLAVCCRRWTRQNSERSQWSGFNAENDIHQRYDEFGMNAARCQQAPAVGTCR